MMGTIKAGLLADLRKRGVDEPATALELLAVRLADLLDAPGIDERHASTIARELRLTLVAVFAEKSPAKDWVDAMQERADGKSQ